MVARLFTLRLSTALLAALALSASVAHAELYKWVDKNGVVNYTDAPPPDAKQNIVEKLGDRISSYTPDAATKMASAYRGPSYYEQQLEREWAQRQRLMASANAMRPPACVGSECYDYDPRYSSSAYYPYGTPVLVTGAVRPVSFRPMRRPPNRPLGSRPLFR